MTPLRPNDAYQARFPLPNSQTPAGIYPTGVTLALNREPAIGCDCATPRIRDPQTGKWLHLETMRRCPKQNEGRA